jgi:hypothetical protein
MNFHAAPWVEYSTDICRVAAEDKGVEAWKDIVIATGKTSQLELAG